MRASHRFLLLGLFLLALAGAAGRARDTGATPGTGEAGLQVTPTPEWSLREALELRSGMRGLRGSELEVARRGAFRALRDVSRRFDRAAAVSAEAAFRAGELARAAGWTEDARAAFARAVEQGAGTGFHGRGLLELGHLARRAGNAPLALAHYEAALFAPSTARVLQDRAALWRGRMQLELGRSGEARAGWWRVAEHALTTLDRIRAHALIAASWSEEGNAERACAVLQHCRVHCAARAAEISDLGLRVRRALARLSCD